MSTKKLQFKVRFLSALGVATYSCLFPTREQAERFARSWKRHSSVASFDIVAVFS